MLRVSNLCHVMYCIASLLWNSDDLCRPRIIGEKAFSQVLYGNKMVMLKGSLARATIGLKSNDKLCQFV